MINRMQQHEELSAASRWLGDEDDDGKSSLMEQLNLSQIERLAKKHPIAVISLGLVAGVALGWWVKRK